MHAPTAIGLAGLSFVLALIGSPSEIVAQDPTPEPPAPAPSGVDPGARLIEGELLELSEGRLDEAVEIYGALLERGDLAPALRARTLFASARAHRKRGELGAAKERYEELVALPDAPAELVEAARRTLEDLAAGADRLPPFDWVAEVEQNPQIQAQIFEWGMQLVGGSEEARKKGYEARDKLLALGVTVIPTLEEMLERSGSAEHRARLASVLVSLGAVRHIPHLLESSETRELPLTLRNGPADRKAEAIRTLASLPDDPEARVFAAKWRLSLGSLERLDDDLRAILAPTAETRRYAWLPLDFERDSGNAAAYRDRLRLVAELSFPHYETALHELLLHAPELLRREDLEPLRVPREEYTLWWLEPLFTSRLEDFLWLCEGAGSSQLLAGIDQALRARPGQPGPPIDRKKREASIESLPVPTRARILRAMRSHAELLALALAEPEAVSEFADFLAEDELPPPGLGFATGPFRVETQRALRGRSVAAEPSAIFPPPRAVPLVLEEAMERVYRSSSDSWRRGIALELIVRAYPNARRESFELLRALLADPAAHPLERVAALTGVLLRLPEHESERDATVELADAYAARISEPEWLSTVVDDSTTGRSVLQIGSQSMSVATGWGVAGELIIDQLRGLDSSWNAKNLIERLATGLLPVIADGRGTELYRRIHMHVRAHQSEGTDPIVAFETPLARWADEVDDPARLRPLAKQILETHAAVTPQPTRAWRRLLADPEVPADVRMRFLRNIIQNQVDPSREAFLRDLDWLALILADDPLADRISSLGWIPVEDEAALRLAARASPRPAIRRWGWTDAKLPATPEELEPAIGSDDAELRSFGYCCLLQADDTRWLPLLHRAVRETSNECREQAIDRLAFFSDESSLPILTALLDDPVFAVRAKALEALEKIEQTLSQQEKWRERFGEKKKKGARER